MCVWAVCVCMCMFAQGRRGLNARETSESKGDEASTPTGNAHAHERSSDCARGRESVSS